MASTKKLYLIREVKFKTSGCQRTRGIRISRGSAIAYGITFYQNGNFNCSTVAVSNNIANDDITYLENYWRLS